MNDKKATVKNLTENEISKIIRSESFKDKLTFLNENYSNQKQELLIRNMILEELNAYFKSNNLLNLRAFAELRVDKTRVDLSIMNTDDIYNPIKIEFKYQFTNDFKQLANYKGVVYNDFENRKSDMFILIISNWAKKDKKKYDDEWRVSPNLSRYISLKKEWKTNIESILNSFIQGELEIFNQINIDKPYPTQYYFYNLKRK